MLRMNRFIQKLVYQILKKHTMDLGTIIIGSVGVAACAMPFVITNRNKKKKEKQLLTMLKDLAKKHNSEITQHEILGYYAIGVDENKKSVSFLLRSEAEITPQFVNLATIKKCEISNVYKETGNHGKQLDQLNLRLSNNDKSKPDIVLEFFNAEVSYQLSDEFDSLEKWNRMINNLLRAIK